MSHGGAHPSPCQTTANVLHLGGSPWSRTCGLKSSRIMHPRRWLHRGSSCAHTQMPCQHPSLWFSRTGLQGSRRRWRAGVVQFPYRIRILPTAHKTRLGPAQCFHIFIFWIYLTILRPRRDLGGLSSELSNLQRVSKGTNLTQSKYSDTGPTTLIIDHMRERWPDHPCSSPSRDSWSHRLTSRNTLPLSKRKITFGAVNKKQFTKYQNQPKQFMNTT